MSLSRCLPVQFERPDGPDEPGVVIQVKKSEETPDSEAIQICLDREQFGRFIVELMAAAQQSWPGKCASVFAPPPEVH